MPDAGIVPYAGRGSAFHRHCRTTGVVALAATSLGMFTPLIAGALTFLTLGLGWGLVAVSASTAAAVTFVNIAALIGNRRLERRLRRQVGPAVAELEFVGLCRSENNSVKGKYLTPRLDTDDNIGFLDLADDALRVITEEGVIAIARDSIREIGRSPCIELPYLSWIRIEVEHADDATTSFLLMSRQAATIRELRGRTEALYCQLVDWHTDAQLRWLENERG